MLLRCCAACPPRALGGQRRIVQCVSSAYACPPWSTQREYLSHGVLNPDVRLDINRAILFERNQHRRKRPFHQQLAGLTEWHSGPKRPVGQAADDRHGARRDLYEFSADPKMGSQPGVDRKAVSAHGVNIVAHRRAWLEMLLVRSHRREQRSKSIDL